MDHITHLTDLLDCALPPAAIERIARQIIIHLRGLPAAPVTLASRDLDAIADDLWSRMAAGGVTEAELSLRARMAVEARLGTDSPPPFGLDRLSDTDAAAYVGVAVTVLRSAPQRRAIGFPAPYRIHRRNYWRRSEIDRWIERQKQN